MKITVEELPNEMRLGKARQHRNNVEPHFQNPRNINNVENPQFRQYNRPNTREGLAPRGRGPPKLTNHNPRDPYFYCKYHGRDHSTKGFPETKKNIARIRQEKAMMSIASTMLNKLRPSF
jgi:hypothetical protein